MGLDINAVIGVAGGIVAGAFSGARAAGIKAKAAKDAAARAEAASAKVSLGAVLTASAELRRAWNEPDSAGWNVESAQARLGDAAGQTQASGENQVATAAKAAAGATSKQDAIDALDRLDDLLSAGASK